MEKFFEQFNNCIQKEVPFCQASCPFHVDIIDFVEKTGRGAFNAAYNTYRNAVTFPAIVAALCTEPCKNQCPRGEKEYGGSAIEIRGLERAVIQQAENKKPVCYNVPGKGRKVAVIGGGISGLACALRLASKKYVVEVFEATNRIGGHLWDIADGTPKSGGLTPEIFTKEFDLQLKQEDISIHYNAEVSNIEELTSQGFEAVYVATGANGNDFGLMDGTGRHMVKGEMAYVAGGSLTGKDTMEALADGIDTALAIEIFLKTGNLNYPYDQRTTKVRIDPSKACISSGPALDSDGKIKQEDVSDEVNRCLKCQCDSCKIYCDLVAYTGKWPLRIKDEVQATMHQGQADVKAQPAKRLINICTHCGLCDDVCPAKIDMDSMFLQARKELHKLNRMPWAFHEFWLRDMEFADGEFAAVVRKPPGVSKADFAFFPGCQLGASEPRYVSDTYAWLLGKEPSMAIFLKCCGTPVKWAGNEEKHNETIERLRDDWMKLGKPKLVVACPSCINNISEFLPEAETISLYEFIEEKGGITPVAKGGRGRLAYAATYAAKDKSGFTPDEGEGDEVWSIFDPCAVSGNEGLRSCVRNLVKEAGFTLEPLPIQEAYPSCCSYGGHVSIANPEFADFVTDRRINESDNPYITYCVNCRDSFLGAGKRCIHILDILFGIGNTKDNAVLPTVTERRENRKILKKRLLKDYWGEETMEKGLQRNIDLKLGADISAKLNRERILEEEIKEVIEFCEASGRKVKLAERDTFSGYRRIGHMTYWVEYRKDGDSFELLNAYSHRMQIDLEAVWNGKKVETDM